MPAAGMVGPASVARWVSDLALRRARLGRVDAGRRSWWSLAAKMPIVRVLLTDGSGLTARQVATELSLAGHRVEVLTPDPLALTRFTRHVARLHKVPPYGEDPFAWLNAALDVYRSGGFDVLFPTQEQVAVLAAVRPSVVTAVPTFEALSRVQDKISAFATLASIGLPQPRSVAVRERADLEGWNVFPAFSKPPIGTATRGIRQSPRTRRTLVGGGTVSLAGARRGTPRDGSVGVRPWPARCECGQPAGAGRGRWRGESQAQRRPATRARAPRPARATLDVARRAVR